jgi:GT2 family glycosyltransferase
MPESGLRITVVVPTFRRAVHLRRCLAALRCQERAPDEVILVIRPGDAQTEEVKGSTEFAPLPLRWLETTASGVVAAENAALEAATSDVVAFTDDDAAPRPDWLRRIEAHFLADPRLGGLGGRDWMHRGDGLAIGSKRDVNRVQWFGRVIGYNHLGVGAPREVDVLKGANMSFRRLAIGQIRFDDRLRGNGAQVHLDHSFALAVKRAGWKLVYDPEVAVDHYLAPRVDEDQRSGFNRLAYRNSVHNQTLGMLEHLPPIRRAVFLGYAILVGTWAAPGFAQWVRMKLRGIEAPTGRLEASLRGRRDAVETWRRTRRGERTSGSSCGVPR